MAKPENFIAVKNRYYTWKSMQHQGRDKTPLAVEQDALEWGYQAGRADVEEQVRERLFDFRP